MSAGTINLDTQAFDFISTLVRDRSAIELDRQKSYLVESRLSPLARENGMSSIGELVTALQGANSKNLKQQVVEAMTTNETSFFRDLHPFQALKNTILPELIKKRHAERKLTIWSNACSTGQEPYSIAMVIRDSFPELASWDVRVVATDICTKVLQRAESGTFNQTEINRGLPMQLLMKFFKRDGLNWMVNDEIRDMIEFRTLNLIEPWNALPVFDIVFIRNVLIYFNVDVKKQILENVHRRILPDGYLFLGGAETTMNLNVNFTREQIGNAACYRPA